LNFRCQTICRRKIIVLADTYTPENQIDLVVCPWEARADEGVARDFVLTVVPQAFKVPRRRSDPAAIKGKLRLYCADVNPRWR
jgi:hypothetical protein